MSEVMNSALSQSVVFVMAVFGIGSLFYGVLGAIQAFHKRIERSAADAKSNQTRLEFLGNRNAALEERVTALEETLKNQAPYRGPQ